MRYGWRGAARCWRTAVLCPADRLRPTPPTPPPGLRRASHSSGRHTLVIPGGGEELNGWVVLRDCIRRVAAFVEGEAPGEASGSQPPPPAQQPVPEAARAEGAAGPSQPPPAPAGEGADAPPLPPLPPLPLLDVSGGPVVGPGHPPPALTTSPQGTPVLSCHGRRVFFDVGSTARGRYMRITEVAHQDRWARAARVGGEGAAAGGGPAPLARLRPPTARPRAAPTCPRPPPGPRS
jgi:hypothetical protein